MNQFEKDKENSSKSMPKYEIESERIFRTAPPIADDNKAWVRPEQAELLEKFIKRGWKRDGAYSTYVLNEELREAFDRPEQFFQAWYNGYAVYDTHSDLSLF
ncbi:hypothetical protein [Priestia megaterium]|uniref:hypothetical protein n=1 Tax=Priestia megaterium TaxID=1404 RepID=UPI000BFA1898|nr:hypothetical protein [Priestia megaterium]PFQ82049.1 hypothetical protein COK11_16345 [Priestia megaterium]